MGSRNSIHGMYAHQNGKCYYCAQGMTFHTGVVISHDSATVDHKIPKAKGGGRGPDNKVLACGKCNHEKGSFTDKEYILVLEYRKNPEAFKAFLEEGK